MPRIPEHEASRKGFRKRPSQEVHVSTIWSRMRCVQALVGGAALTVIFGLGAGLGGCKSKQSAPGGGNADDGTTITMWTRAATEAQSKLLVEGYNASHKNKVE